MYALYGNEYSDPGVVDLIGLEDVLFRDFKNDVAFSVAGQRIVLSEHQSTVNANMPIRDLLYIVREYEKVIPARSKMQGAEGIQPFCGDCTKKPKRKSTVDKSCEGMYKKGILADYLSRNRDEQNTLI